MYTPERDLSDTISGLSSGGHYVGAGSTTHACPDTNTRHEGDMGNWTATTTGIQQTKTLNLLTLTGANSIIGRNVILHLSYDNCTVQPSGNAGQYIAYGTIGIVNNTQNAANTGNYDGSILNAVSVLYPTNLAATYCTNGQCSGRITFTQNDDTTITVLAVVQGLTAATSRGLHVHTFGDLSTPATGLSVGGHWNPTNNLHALPNVATRHLGDLGNVQSFDSSSGNGYYSASFPAAQFGNLTSVLGRGVVVHAGNDNGDGANCDQAGGSGARILWGVIGAKNTNQTLSASIVVPSTVTINNNYMAMPCSPSTSPSISLSPYISPSPSPSSGSNLMSWVNVLQMF